MPANALNLGCIRWSENARSRFNLTSAVEAKSVAIFTPSFVNAAGA